MQKIIIPHDVADHLKQMAEALIAHQDALTFDLRLWGDGEVDDPETGDEWMVKLNHSSVEKLIDNLGQMEKFVDWLRHFTPDDEWGVA